MRNVPGSILGSIFFYIKKFVDDREKILGVANMASTVYEREKGNVKGKRAQLTNCKHY